jgi:hypothetical protein
MESAREIPEVLPFFGAFANLVRSWLPEKLRPCHQVLKQFVKLGGIQLLR